MAEAKKIKARVLVDCGFGKVNDVVELTEAEAKANSHEVDTDKGAVAYAESLNNDQA